MTEKKRTPSPAGDGKKSAKKASPAKSGAAKRAPRAQKAPADDAAAHYHREVTSTPDRPRDLVEALLAHADQEEQQARAAQAAAPQPVTETRTSLPAVFREDEAEPAERGDIIKPLMGHLDEFRGRLLMILATILLFTVGGLFLSDYLLETITRPFVASGQKLNVFTLTGGIMIRIKAAFGAGFLLALPVLIFQIWRFLAPALKMSSRRYMRLTMIAAVFLFYAGVAFVYFLLLPVAVKIMLGFVGPGMVTTIGAEDYLSFVLLFCLAMGALFEFPIVVLVLTKLGIITPHLLTTKRKYAIVVIWVIAAVITPTPDPINQGFVAVPLMIFYEISILISRLVYRKKQQAAEE